MSIIFHSKALVHWCCLEAPPWSLSANGTLLIAFLRVHVFWDEGELASGQDRGEGEDC